jgi:type VI secretion system secreted protein VgrG
MNVPRVGQEVLVEFLGNDPDRPIITGRVYTNLQRVPYPLPANRSKSGWRTASVGDSDNAGYNELMFEDAQGKELVRVHAERDYERVVKASESTSVGADQSLRIGNNRSALIRGEDLSMSRSVVANVQESRRDSIGSSHVVVVGGDRSTEIGGDEHMNVGGGLDISAGGAKAAIGHGHVRFDAGTGATIEIDGDVVRIRAARVELLSSELVAPDATRPGSADGAHQESQESANVS